MLGCFESFVVVIGWSSTYNVTASIYICHFKHYCLISNVDNLKRSNKVTKFNEQKTMSDQRWKRDAKAEPQTHNHSIDGTANRQHFTNHSAYLNKRLVTVGNYFGNEINCNRHNTLHVYLICSLCVWKNAKKKSNNVCKMWMNGIGKKKETEREKQNE